MNVAPLARALSLALVCTACGGAESPAPSNSAATAPAGGDAGGAPGAERDAATTAPPDDGAAPTSSVDPTRAGPFAIAEIDAVTKVKATGDDVGIHCAYPTSPNGAVPVIVVAHGFQIAASQYRGYVRRLATFGYVALTADYPAGFASVSNVRDAQNLSGSLDWAASAPQLAAVASTAKSGVMGHSRGGKAAALAAARDPRFVAMLGLDPVDAKPPLGCNEQTECPDSRDALAARAIPTAFLGETTDATGGGLGQACAPAAGNYATFFAKAPPPSIEVTVNGANHVSFVDDPAACGLTCSLCRPETSPHAKVLELAYAVSVAFFERHLRGVTAYDGYLGGAQAQTLWVAPGLAVFRSK